MSKAIQGAAMLGAAVAMGTAAFFNPALIANPYFDKIMASLALGGISMEAGAIAGALTQNRGTTITTRQPAAFRQYVYGTQRIGGVLVYESTTGSHHDQYNMVIALADHECDSILGLYLDGRKVNFEVGSVGNSTRNGVNFGGHANGGTYTGPGGAQYNFGGLVYCEACYGDQTNQPNTVPGGGFNTGLQANDPSWTTTSQGLPYLGGVTYFYLKVEYDATMFPQRPEVKVTLRGKNDIFDPRTGTTGFTNNWALVVADVIRNGDFGLNDDTINEAQLIAAANVCDEDSPLAAGGVEKRWCCDYHFDSSVPPSDVLQAMMPAAAGRLSRIGGEWYVWPAYWQGPSLQLGKDDCAKGYQWNSYRSLSERFNRVTGTYVAANYPYNATTEYGSNVYDANGFYDGTIENNFEYAFQPTNYPQFACDAQHGYSSDQYLIADNNQPLPREIGQQCVLSITQAQRAAKVMLLRNRQEGTGSFTFKLGAYQLQPCSVMQFTFPQEGWTQKLLEVNSVGFSMETGPQGAPALMVKMGVNETTASVYAWSSAEERSPYDVQIAPVASYTPAAPLNLTLTSVPLYSLDGFAQPRVRMSWDDPLDGFVTEIELGVQGPIVSGSAVPAWTPAGPGKVDSDSTSVLIPGLVAGQTYNFRVRSLRANGAASVWTEVDAYTVSVVLSQLSQLGVGVGSLTSEAYTGGGAAIDCAPFNFPVGSDTISVAPAPFQLTSSSTGGVSAAIAQAQQYDVYYIDAAYAGGAVTPIATQNPADYRGKPGYFLIDSIVTLVNTGTTGGGGAGTGMRYYPSASHEVGTRSTVTPEASYDGNTGSAATLSATAGGGGGATTGDLIVQGFPSADSSAVSTLTVIAQVQGSVEEASVTANWGGTSTALFDVSVASAKTTYTLTIPASTVFAGISLEGYVASSLPTSGTTMAKLLIYEIYIDT